MRAKIVGFWQVLGLVCGGLFGFFLATAQSEAQIVTTGFTAIVSVDGAQCLTSRSFSLLQEHCNVGDNQQWGIAPEKGAFEIISKQSRECVSIAGTKLKPEWPSRRVVPDSCAGAPGELWDIVAAGDGRYQIVSRLSRRCLALEAGESRDGSGLEQSLCEPGQHAQLWVFASGLLEPNQPANLMARQSGQCLVETPDPSAGNIVQYPCRSANSGMKEQWMVRPSGSYYELVAGGTAACLTLVDGLGARECRGSENQLWKFTSMDGAFEVAPKDRAGCLTVSSASQEAGAAVALEECQGSQNQLWALSPAQIPSKWSAVIPLPIIPIAAAQLPSGKLLTWSANNEFTYNGPGNLTYTSIFDPATDTSAEATISNTGADMFCPGTSVLPNGDIFVNGGSSSYDTSIYHPDTNSWTADAHMNIPRGYEANTVLSNGFVLTLGGSWSGGAGGKTAELWSAGLGWNLLKSVPESPIIGSDPQGVWRGDNHPWLFAMGNGQVLHAGPSARMNWISTGSDGTITSLGDRGDDTYSINGKAVMYDVGKILKTGGTGAYLSPVDEKTYPANANTYIISVNSVDSNQGVSVRKTAPMAFPRAFANAVVLPNGQVVVVGGQTVPNPFYDTDAVLIPEIWDPISQVFRQLSPMQTPRNYHSTAILLEDGRVFVGGGGQCGESCTGNHFDAEILTPPYLLTSDGSPAARPAITRLPASASLGSDIRVSTDAPVVSFALIRLSAVTHSVNNDERRIPLAIKSARLSSYLLSIPADPGVLIPGNYMLFALDAKGVPSRAQMISLREE